MKKTQRREKKKNVENNSIAKVINADISLNPF